MTQKEIVQKLHRITNDYNFIYVIAAIVYNDFCGPLENLEHKDYWKQLNYNELSFLVGLWVKNAKIGSVSEFDVNAEYRKINALMEELHNSFLREGPKLNLADINRNTKSDFLINGTHLKEAFFYSSTGAYDYQFINNTIEKYCYDINWIEVNKNFPLSALVDFFKHVKGSIQKKLNSPRHKTKSGIPLEYLLDIFCFTEEELVNENAEFKSITSHFTIELGKGHAHHLNEIGDFNEFQAKPIIRLTDNKYFIPQPFFLAEAIYEAPFYWMMEDTSYRAKSLENRGSVAENKVFKLFSNVFGPANTLKSVKIKKNLATTESDIDVIGIYKETAIIAQIKSKKLTAMSKKGDIAKIKDDYKKAFEDAYSQGVVCENCIREYEDYDFITDDNIKVNDKISKIKKTYIICVVIDTYPALSHLTQVLLYENPNVNTICVTTLDLDVICRYLNTPQKIITYFSERISKCRVYHGENELCFLGFYLEHGFNLEEGYTHGVIENSYGGKIDGMYYSEISGERQLNPAKKVGRNDKCPCGSNIKYKKCHGESR